VKGSSCAMTHDSIKGTTAAQTSQDQIIASMFGSPVYAIRVTVRSTMVDYSEACRMCCIHVATVERRYLPKSHKPYKRESRTTNPQSRASSAIPSLINMSSNVSEEERNISTLTMSRLQSRGGSPSIRPGLLQCGMKK
jgi:hypothetical protein